MESKRNVGALPYVYPVYWLSIWYRFWRQSPPVHDAYAGFWPSNKEKRVFYFCKLAVMRLSRFSDMSAGQRFEPSYPSTTHPPHYRCTATPFLYSALTLLSSVPYVSRLTQVSNLKKNQQQLHSQLFLNVFSPIRSFVYVSGTW